jgi:hypothetical protein
MAALIGASPPAAELRGQGWQTIKLAVGVAVFHLEIAALDGAKIAKPK